MLKEMPQARLVVHTDGMQHMIDPARLINSSKRVFGRLIDEWYDEVVPVEEHKVLPVKGGETIDLGNGQRLLIIDSPGHSNNHICIYSEKVRGLFTGDVGGVCLHNSEIMIPTTPTPEFDPDINIKTIKSLMALDLKLLLFSHFGATDNPYKTLNKSISWLTKWKKTVSDMAGPHLSHERIIETFKTDISKAMGSKKGLAPLYQWLMAYHVPMCASGYLNYFKKGAI